MGLCPHEETPQECTKDISRDELKCACAFLVLNTACTVSMRCGGRLRRVLHLAKPKVPIRLWVRIHLCVCTFLCVCARVCACVCACWCEYRVCANIHLAYLNVTRMNESRHKYIWAMWHIWMRHGTHMIDLCRTCACVMWHVRMSHVIHMNESVTHMYESYIWHVSFICYIRRDSFIYVTWLIHLRDMTHSYMWHDSSSIYATWLIHMCNMTRL